MTIGRQWAWKPNDEMKSFEQCIRTLVSTAGGDGNLLFNVGPMPDGRIEPRQVERLREMGRWLKTNGESVYGTRGGPFKPGKWGCSTRKDGRIYLHVFEWDKNTLKLPNLKQKIQSASLLNGPKVGFTQNDNNVHLNLEKDNQDAVDTVIVLRLAE